MSEVKIIKPRAEIFQTVPPAFIDANQITVNIVEKISYPPEGGVYVYYVGAPYPKKGAPFPEVVEAMNTVKKAFLGIANTISGLRHPVNAFLENLAIFTKAALGKYHLKPDRYCTSGRELLRCVELVENPHLKEIMLAGIMTWEFDVAYRYPSQDVAGEINVEALKENPRKELLRVMEIAAERSLEPIAKKWRAFKTVAGILLFIPSVKKFIRTCADVIDWEKLRFDQGDTYWVLGRRDYNYFGKSLEERMEMLEAYE